MKIDKTSVNRFISAFCTVTAALCLASCSDSKSPDSSSEEASVTATESATEQLAETEDSITAADLVGTWQTEDDGGHSISFLEDGKAKYYGGLTEDNYTWSIMDEYEISSTLKAYTPNGYEGLVVIDILDWGTVNVFAFNMSESRNTLKLTMINIESDMGGILEPLYFTRSDCDIEPEQISDTSRESTLESIENNADKQALCGKWYGVEAGDLILNEDGTGEFHLLPITRWDAYDRYVTDSLAYCPAGDWDGLIVMNLNSDDGITAVWIYVYRKSESGKSIEIKLTNDLGQTVLDKVD